MLLVSVLTLSAVAMRWNFGVPNVSAVTTTGNVGVFWDSACTRDVTLTGVNWGNVTIGTETDIIVYAKNLGQSAIILSMNSSSWNPLSASSAMFLLWDYNGIPISAGGVIKLTLRLYVASNITGVTNFNFNINIGTGLEKPFDLNGDGRVDISDAAMFARNWNARVGNMKYNYSCDFNDDGAVDVVDAAALARAWTP